MKLYISNSKTQFMLDKNDSMSHVCTPEAWYTPKPSIPKHAVIDRDAKDKLEGTSYAGLRIKDVYAIKKP